MISEYYGQLYTNKLNDLDETQNLPRLNHKETENLSTPITSNQKSLNK